MWNLLKILGNTKVIAPIQALIVWCIQLVKDFRKESPIEDPYLNAFKLGAFCDCPVCTSTRAEIEANLVKKVDPRHMQWETIPFAFPNPAGVMASLEAHAVSPKAKE